jgi:hypothetical protein
MPFKPNYRQQRNDRQRAKDQKKQEKLQRRADDAARRHASEGETDAQPADEQTRDS